MQIDHVLIAVADLDAAAAEFEERHGLVALGGGRHPGWGTANRIVPLGDTYLELIAIVDPAEAAASVFGRLVASVGEPSGQLLAWAARTEIESTARRLGLEVTDGSRTTPDGQTLTWRLAGVAEAVAEPPLPFYIEWGEDTPHPGAMAATDRRIERLELSGDETRIRAWLGDDCDPRVAVREGPPAIVAVGLSGGLLLR